MANQSLNRGGTQISSAENETNDWNRTVIEYGSLRAGLIIKETLFIQDQVATASAAMQDGEYEIAEHLLTQAGVAAAQRMKHKTITI